VHACGVEGSRDETEGSGEPEEGLSLTLGCGVFVEARGVVAVGGRVEGCGCCCDSLGESVVNDLEKNVGRQGGEGE